MKNVKKFPKCEEYGLLNKNEKWLADKYGAGVVGIDRIEQALTSAENKGKLAGKRELAEILEKKITRMEKNEAGLWEQRHITRLKGHLGWLKSQQKGAKK